MINAFSKDHILATFFAVGVFAPIMWMAMDRNSPYEVLKSEILPPSPAPGDTAIAKFKVKVHKQCKASPDKNVKQFIIDATGRLFSFDPVPSLYSTETNLGSGEVTREIHIPKDVTPGPAHYRVSGQFACNPIQELWPVRIIVPDIPFEVVQR